MSFVFAWDKLDDEVALQIEGMIHAHFQRIPKPSYMGNIAVSKFRFGSTPPSVTVLDITDPLEEWYVHMDQEEVRLAQEAAEAGGGESMDEDELASGDEYGFPYSADSSVVMVGDGDDIEYLEPGGSFQDEEQLQTEEWLHQQQQTQRRVGSNSGDSYREDILSNSASRKAHSRKSAATSRNSPSSSTSSINSPSYGQSTSHSNRFQGEDSEAVPNVQASTDTSAPRNPSTTHSLSSHTSDDDIESDAFYTQGESTVYQRMKNLVLDSTNSALRTPASAEESPSKHPPQLTTSTSGTTNGSMSNGLGLGLSGGIGSSPASVLSTVMQNRTTLRPLSAASFYSSPTPTGLLSPGAGPGQSSQMYFSDLSGMVVSGNSFLGLRAGTPSRTIPSTPRGFESPTLAFSRRQSFSESGGDDSQAIS
ncbi:Mitochondrial distribution and morphology protein 12, partial [Modicella reniformis]